MNFRAEDKQLIDGHIAAMSKDKKSDCLPEVTLNDYIKSIEDKYPVKRDSINPKHYDLFPEYGIQVRELMQVLCNKLDTQGYSGFLVSDYVQAMQYFLRWFEKNGKEDVAKGVWYMNKIIQQLEELEKGDS